MSESISQEVLEVLDAIMEEQHKEIPENSKSILVKETTSRFSGAIWYNKIQEMEVTLAGVGGIGSWVALLLAKLDIARLNMYDFDSVEPVNMAGQFYSNSQIGSFKTSAVSESLRHYARYFKAYCFNQRYTENDIRTKVMICGFDNMEARKTFFYSWLEAVKSSNTKNEFLFIDGRLNAEEFQVFAIEGDNVAAIDKYKEEFLFDDSEVEETICSYKQTSFMSNMIASFMVNIFVNFVANQCDPIIPRDIPFFTSYTADTMFTKMMIL